MPRPRSHATQGAIPKVFVAAAAVAAVLYFGFTPPAQAQTLTVLHQFSNGLDGGYPMTGLTPDAAGNFYGTTEEGGAQGYGTVFKLSRHNGSWVLTVLYGFQGFLDGGAPLGRVVFGPGGALYGTASVRGHCDACGLVFELRPPATPCGSLTCPWVKTTLHMFMRDGVDGYGPTGDLIFDRAGNIYGTTTSGGANNSGAVYELTPMNGSWTETILHSFSGADGARPTTGVIFDSSGNLYGTTPIGGSSGDGVIFELSPSGSGWTETVLHSFTDMSPDGSHPYAGLTPDGVGGFYGTAFAGGTGLCFGTPGIGCGTVFQGQGSTLYSFSEPGLTPPGGPMSPVTLDPQGNLYGTTSQDGANLDGNVFMLTAGQYNYASLYDFTDGNDGRTPVGNIVRDANGNLFGTTSSGGAHNAGVVWELTP